MVYDKLNKQNLDVLLDDRTISVGIKFKDMDLIGIPKRIIVGKKIVEGKVEVKERITGEMYDLLISDI